MNQSDLNQQENNKPHLFQSFVISGHKCLHLVTSGHLYHCPLAVGQHPPPSRAVDVVRLGVVQVVVVGVAVIFNVIVPRGVAVGLGTLLVLVLS